LSRDQRVQLLATFNQDKHHQDQEVKVKDTDTVKAKAKDVVKDNGNKDRFVHVLEANITSLETVST